MISEGNMPGIEPSVPPVTITFVLPGPIAIEGFEGRRVANDLHMSDGIVARESYDGSYTVALMKSAREDVEDIRGHVRAIEQELRDAFFEIDRVWPLMHGGSPLVPPETRRARRLSVESNADEVIEKLAAKEGRRFGKVTWNFEYGAFGFMPGMLLGAAIEFALAARRNERLSLAVDLHFSTSTNDLSVQRSSR